MGSEVYSAESIREIVGLGDKARKTQFIQTPAEPKHVYYAVKSDGDYTRIAAEAPLSSRTLERPDDIAAFVDNGLVLEGEGRNAIYYDEDGIVVIEDGDIRTKTEAPLTMSPQWQLLVNSSSRSMKQREFIRLLRIDLRGCLDGAPLLLGLIRNLKFTNSGNVAANIQHGKESMGKQIESQCSGEDSIPEEVRITVPVWRNWNVTMDIQCAIEIFTEEQQFRLTPYPMELDRAMDRALMMLHKFLVGDATLKRPPVYRGRPIEV